MSISLKAWLKQSSPFRIARAMYYGARAEVPLIAVKRRTKSDDRMIEHYFSSTPVTKMQISAGNNGHTGWLNTEYLPTSNELIHLDATIRFPFDDAVFDLIFSEHVIEHLSLAGGVKLIEQSFRVLKPNGRLRISTPPFQFLLNCYFEPEKLINKQYIDWHFGMYNSTSSSKEPIVLFNDYIRMWGHTFIYDEALLKKLFEQAGFVDVQMFEINQSADQRLTNLENDTRMPPGFLQLSTMTVEGRKLA